LIVRFAGSYKVQARIWVQMNTQPRTIAVVDDDPRVLESLLNFFASCGYKAETYLSAEQFLESGALSRCECIVADIEMRKMSGLGLLQYISSKNLGIPVVIITGKRYEDSEAFYRERGAIGFFRKPVDCDALLQLINSVCT
jgi:FixJ family two-component response regulator